MSEKTAANCNPCICDEPKVKCILGPDEEGTLTISKVAKTVAEICDRRLCTCTSHDDYAERMFERFEVSDNVTVIPDVPFSPRGIESITFIDEDPEEEEEKSLEEIKEELVNEIDGELKDEK